MKTEQQNNYRIYDQTGGGTTEDIYAASLADAIKYGRKWIEAGDWDKSDDGVYRTITLECCVREIVRYPAPDAEGKATAADGTPLTQDEDGDMVDAGGCVYYTAADIGQIDEAATNDGDEHDCTGTYSDKLPECEAAEDGVHDWRSPYSLVGGLKENPGFWSRGGTVTVSREVCACCGCYKTETDKGSQCHESEARVVIEIESRDSDSEEWLKERHIEDGYLPDWLAEYLGEEEAKLDA